MDTATAARAFTEPCARVCQVRVYIYIYISIYALYSFTHVFTGHFFPALFTWCMVCRTAVSCRTPDEGYLYARGRWLHAVCRLHLPRVSLSDLEGGECTWGGGSGWGRWHDSTFLTPLLDVALHKRVSGCSGPVTPVYYCVIFCCEFPSAAVPGRLTWSGIHLFDITNLNDGCLWWQMPVKHTLKDTCAQTTHHPHTVIPKQFRRLYFVIYEQNLWHL